MLLNLIISDNFNSKIIKQDNLLFDLPPNGDFVLWAGLGSLNAQMFSREFDFFFWSSHKLRYFHTKWMEVNLHLSQLCFSQMAFWIGRWAARRIKNWLLYAPSTNQEVHWSWSLFSNSIKHLHNIIISIFFTKFFFNSSLH